MSRSLSRSDIVAGALSEYYEQLSLSQEAYQNELVFFLSVNSLIFKLD